MKRFLRSALIVLVVLAALAVGLPYVVPLGNYRGRIEDAARTATGRALHIEGPLRLMFFPRFGLKAEQVTFANMPGGRAAAMASVGDIVISIRLLPLLHGQVQVDRITLDRPVIALEVDQSGNANWSLGSRKTSAATSAVTLPAETEFSGIRINDGRLAYDNFKTGTHRVLDHVNADIALTRLDEPLSVDGNLALGEGQVDVTARVATIKSLLDNGTTALSLEIKGDAFQAAFKGAMTPDGGISGDARFSSGALRKAAALMGESLPQGGGFGVASLSSHIAYKAKVALLSPFRLSLDRQTISGQLTLDEHGATPALSGTLSADRLDLNPYLAAPSGARAAAQRSSSGWSREPINLAMLKSIDAKLELSTGSLRLRQLTLGRTVAAVTLAQGAFAARLDPISLYGGTGHAELEVDTRGNVPQFRNDMAFQHVSLQRFLADTLGIDSIEGSGALTLTIAAQGASADAAMHSLSGRGTIAAVDGRIQGVDLGMVARTIQTVLNAGATSRAANTGFHNMGGSFAIANGVLSNGDFHISGPVVQMTGAGQIDIGNRAIDFRLVPKAGVAGFGIGIPFRITGSWDHVHYMPDLEGMVGGVLQNLQQGVSPIQNLFGGDKSAPKKAKSKKPNDGLKSIFGIP